MDLKTRSKPEVGAVIVAAGLSQRMGGMDKVTAPLGDRSVLERVIEVFHNCESVCQMVVVVTEKNVDWCRQLKAEQAWHKITAICCGGKRRQDSVAAGLKRIHGCQWVVIHDGARPLLTEDLIYQGLTEAQETGAAVAAVPVTDTIKSAGSNRVVRQTLPRHKLWAIQTPQVFRFDIISEAYRQTAEDATDDASLVEKLGYRVKLYRGTYKNIKITTPEDLAAAEVWCCKDGD